MDFNGLPWNLRSTKGNFRSRNCSMNASFVLIAFVFVGVMSSAISGSIAGPRQFVAEGEAPDLAVDRDGTLHVVYVRAKEVHYRRQPAGGEFEREITVGAGADPAIGLGPEGTPHIAVVGERSSSPRPSISERNPQYAKGAGRETKFIRPDQNNQRPA